MIHLPRPAIGRRPLWLGAAGTAMALAAARCRCARSRAPPARRSWRAGGARPSGAQSAVDHRRQAHAPRRSRSPSRIWSAATAVRPSSAATSPASSPTTWAIAACSSRSRRRRSFNVGARAGHAQLPELGAIGAQALVTGRRRSAGRRQIRVEFRLWDVLPQAQIQGTAYTTAQANWRRIAHIIGRRDLRAAARREGLFRHPHRLRLRHRPARPADQAAGDHGPGRREQPLS